MVIQVSLISRLSAVAPKKSLHGRKPESRARETATKVSALIVPGQWLKSQTPKLCKQLAHTRVWFGIGDRWPQNGRRRIKRTATERKTRYAERPYKYESTHYIYFWDSIFPVPKLYKHELVVFIIYVSCVRPLNIRISIRYLFSESELTFSSAQ